MKHQGWTLFLVLVLGQALVLSHLACGGGNNNPTTPGGNNNGSNPTSTFTTTAQATNTQTSSPTFTKTLVNSPSPTLTLTNTPTNSPTGTPTVTSTPTLTGTITNTPVFTATGTITGTPTSSSTETATDVPSGTPTTTSTTTSTPIMTGTLTFTTTPDPSDTPTASGTPTATLTQTDTPTDLPTSTPTDLPTATSTPTSTSTVGIGSACSYDSDCATGDYCSGVTCAAKLNQGNVCSAADQCITGNCVDGYCCNTACGSGVCSAVLKGGGSNGVCGCIAIGLPYPLSPNQCCTSYGAGGVCQNAPTLTPTVTPTSTPSATPTSTPTASPTVTLTGTFTPTPGSNGVTWTFSDCGSGSSGPTDGWIQASPTSPSTLVSIQTITGLGSGLVGSSTCGLAFYLPGGAMSNGMCSWQSTGTDIETVSAYANLSVPINWTQNGLTTISLQFTYNGYGAGIQPIIVAGSGPTTYSGTVVNDNQSSPSWLTAIFSPSFNGSDGTQVLAAGLVVNEMAPPLSMPNPHPPPATICAPSGEELGPETIYVDNIEFY